MSTYPEISFDNTEYAFQYKTNEELKSANFLFSAMANRLLVKLGTRMVPWAIKAGLPINGIIKKTIFKQFAGGETLEETSVLAKHLAKYNVGIILDYAVEGGDDSEAEYEHAAEEFIKVISYAATQPNIPFMSVKVTGLSRETLLEKLDKLMKNAQGSLIKRYLNSVAQLPEDEKQEWKRVKTRLSRICQHATEKNVGMMIDAEESWITDPVDALVMLMMDAYNKERPVIFNTAQLYRHDRLEFVKDCYEAAAERGFIFAIKLVRGAYMEKERNRAKEYNYLSPIQTDKTATDNDYNEAVAFCIRHLDRIAVNVSSHNENSNMVAVKELEANNIPLNHPHVSFSQLLGMSDNITFNLAHAGCNVSKYLPFGPVKEVIPYLMRRAQENTSVEGQTGREISLIKKEVKRRKL